MNLTWLIQTVNELVAFKNSVVTLSKRIFQLPISTAGTKWVAVHNESSLVTEKFNLTDALAEVYSITNGITALGNITRDGADFTFEVGFQWRINGINYLNAEIERTIEDAGTGNHRIDIAVVDENDDIYIVEGFEVPLATAVVQPPTPPNTLFLCSFLITESVIGDPSEPIITEQNNIPLKVNILSTDLATDDIAGFVDYFNALNPPLEILETTSLVQYFCTDTESVYQLTGVGKGVYGLSSLQITSANVLKFSAGGGATPDLESVLTEGDRPIKDVTALPDYTFVLGDETKFILDIDTGDKTLPPSVFSQGAEIIIQNGGSATTNILRGVGVSIVGGGVNSDQTLEVGFRAILKQSSLNYWEFNKIGYTTSTPNLEQVLTVGGTATDLMISLGSASNNCLIELNPTSSLVTNYDFVTGDSVEIYPNQIKVTDGVEDVFVYKDKLQRSKGGFETDLLFTDPTANRSITFDDEDGTVAMRSYVDNKVAGLLDLRGLWDASGNIFPTTGGSGAAGAILKGDFWYVSVAGVLNGVTVNIGDSFFANVDSPTSSDWLILEANLGYVPENIANKTDNMTGNTASSTKYLSTKGTFDWVTGLTWLTNTIFGTFLQGQTAKDTLVDADGVVSFDSADSNKSKKTTWLNVWVNYLKAKADLLYGPKSDYIKLTAARTLASTTSLQSIFGLVYNAPANRTIRFRVEFDLTGLSSSSNDISFGVIGTAGISSINYKSVAIKSANLNGLNTPVLVSGQLTTATAIVNANTTTTGKAFISGTIITSTSGTIDLAVATSVAVGSAQVSLNSLAKITDIGPDTLSQTSNIS